MLGDRYRLVAPVGVGTSSRVFLAVDTQLRRRVAVKLLHEALAEDEAFLRRFRAEARAAGALSHPNILAVFDWGEDRSDGTVVPYLVTEYLGGGSLRDVLDRGQPLSPSQTLVVGLDAARGLAHAHQRGLVHRDVKPANLLFDEEGRLRLADFGLARALAEASWTEPTGLAVGTARYASPEQALGRRLDGRSDVYSLALVLVECVSGRVPFSGDTTAATLALRTQRDLELGPELGGLRSVLERAGRLDPDERPEAAEFEIGLMAAAEDLERPEPLPLVPTLGDGEQTSEMHLVRGLEGITLLDPTTFGDPVPDPSPADPADTDRSDTDPVVVDPGDPEVLSGPEPEALEPAAAAAEGSVAEPDVTDPLADAPAAPEPVDRGPSRSPIEVAEEHERLSGSRPTSFGPVEPLVGNRSSTPTDAPRGRARRRAERAERRAERASAKAEERAAAAAARSERPRRRGLRRTLLVLLVLALVAAAAGGWWFFVRTPVHDLPDLVGLPVAEATEQAEAQGWVVDDAEVDRRDGTEPGDVLEQSPAVGEPLAEGEVVRLTVSLGATLAPYPDVVGLPGPEARTQLEGAGFVVGEVRRAFDEEVPADQVISATPAEGQPTPDDQGRLPKETVVDLVVSDGPAPRAVPAGLQGARVADAEAALGEAGLEPTRNEAYSEDVPEGYVISVSEDAGTELARGTTVTLEVSLGPAPIPVPDVSFQSGAIAAEMLEDVGFVVTGIEGSPSGMVLATDPPAGEEHPRGTAVRIFTRS